MSKEFFCSNCHGTYDTIVAGYRKCPKCDRFMGNES